MGNRNTEIFYSSCKLIDENLIIYVSQEKLSYVLIEAIGKWITKSLGMNYKLLKHPDRLYSSGEHMPAFRLPVISSIISPVYHLLKDLLFKISVYHPMYDRIQEVMLEMYYRRKQRIE